MENVKQLLILNRNLTIKKILSINKVIPVQDIISPQKTTFEIVKNKDIVIGDLVVLKKENDIEYIGIVQDNETDITTKIATYPLISITDTDCIMGNINGNVFNWIKDVFEYNLVKTLTDNSSTDYVDNLLALPFEFKDNTGAKTLKLEVKNGNLFDVLIDIFKKTGVYLSFSLQFIQGKVSSVLINVNVANEETKTILRYDNPLIIEEPVIESSQYQDVNKIIFVPNNDNTTADAKNIYVFYLLDNNTVTTNPKGTDTGKRINGVKQTIQEYSDDDYTKGLQSIAEETMLGNTLDHQITIKLLQNSGFDVQLYDRVSYIDTQKTYDTYVTRIENYNDKYKTIKLGVLRTTLTDKIKNIEKMLSKKSFGVQVSGGTSGGGSSVNIYNGLDSDSTTDALSAKQGKVLDEKKADRNEIPNTSNFITKQVNDLENYYSKNQTYNKVEIDLKISGVEGENSPFMPVGSIFASAIPQTDARVHLLDGSIISQTGVYASFSTLLKTLVSSGYAISCTQDEFDADVTTTGNCGKFVIDDTAGTIRLPRIVTFIQGLDNLTNIGSSLSAGLPNITGETSNVAYGKEKTPVSSGALSVGSQIDYWTRYGSGSSIPFSTHKLSINASKSSSIYGKSTTVQPNATQYPYYIVLASGYKSSQVVDIDNIINETNVIVKSYSMMPSSKWIKGLFTNKAVGKYSYVPPANGWIMINFQFSTGQSATNGQVILWSEKTNTSSTQSCPVYGWNSSRVMIPVIKGDDVRFEIQGTALANIWGSFFIYAQGQEV